MKSKSETGDAINVANFEDLISRCTGYTKYNPANNQLNIATLTQQYLQARQLLSSEKDVFSSLTKNINTRQYAFDELPKFSTRLLNAIIASGADAKIIADAKTVNRKMQGQRATAIATTQPVSLPENADAQEVQKKISVSQRSMDSLLNNIDKLAKLAQQETGYQPNEQDLSKNGLVEYISSLHKLNTGVINAHTDWAAVRISKNEFLYAPETGLVDTAKKVKSYVKSVDTTGEFFKLISKIPFKKLVTSSRKKKS